MVLLPTLFYYPTINWLDVRFNFGDGSHHLASCAYLQNKHDTENTASEKKSRRWDIIIYSDLRPSLRASHLGDPSKVL